MSEPEDTESEYQSNLTAHTEAAPDTPARPATSVELDPSAGTVEIVVGEGDHTSGIVDQLRAHDDLMIRIEPLDVADYVVSARVAVKRVHTQQLHSLTDEEVQHLVDQFKALAEVYSRSILVLEGDVVDSETASLDVHAVRARLTTNYLTLLETGTPSETAALLATIARREQSSTSKSRSPHQGTQAMTLAEQQEYVVASITELGPVAAEALLDHFSSVELVMSSSKQELMEVPGIGEEIATRIRNIVSSDYHGPPR